MMIMNHCLSVALREMSRLRIVGEDASIGISSYGTDGFESDMKCTKSSRIVPDRTEHYPCSCDGRLSPV